MTKLLLNIFLVFAVFWSFGQTKKVDFVGSARSEISQFSLNSDDFIADTITPGKNSTGYALIDLGFKINPNNSTEILGMLRIRNAFGGFWGSGVTFDVRQLYVRGVVANAFRYQIGNIDYKLTPFTFFNHNTDQIVALNPVQKIKRDIVDYETFFTKNNTWRQQGAAVDFGLKFGSILDEMKFNGFITRLNPTNYTTILERFYGGGNIIIKQSKYAMIGFNYVSVFDLKGTAVDSNAFRNNVTSMTFQSEYAKEKWKLYLNSETGISSSTYAVDTSNNINDYFFDGKLGFKHNPSNVTVEAGYMNVGADFRSIGAQSKRVDFSRSNSVYERYTNSQMIRPISIFDLNQNSDIYSASISDKIMDYSPIYNNVLPYGKATFNRKGLYSTISYQDKKGAISAKADGYFLSEVRGQGTTNLKKFMLINGNINCDFGKLFNWKLQKSLMIGTSMQNTSRSSEFSFETIDLQSLSYSIGIDIEFIKQFHLIAGVQGFQTSGNELLPVRDDKGEIFDFTEFKVNGSEAIYSGGLRFDFTDKIYLAAMYDSFMFSYDDIVPYQLNQFLIVYNMKF